MFAEWMLGFTWLSFSALLPTLVIPILAFRRRFESASNATRGGAGPLLAFYFGTPYVATNWFHVNSRFIAFLWIAMLLRVPARIDRRLAAARRGRAPLQRRHGHRLRAPRRQSGQGDRGDSPRAARGQAPTAHVQSEGFQREHAERPSCVGLLRHKKQTSAPSSSPTRARFPSCTGSRRQSSSTTWCSRPTHQRWSRPSGSAACSARQASWSPTGANTWRQRWADFWAVVTPEFDHVMMWDSPPEVVALIPRHYRVKFAEDKLLILERVVPPLSERSRPSRRALADADDAALAIDSSR